ALIDYQQLRATRATGPLLIGPKGGRLNLNTARAAFRTLVNDCRLPVRPGCRAPRLHDCRHTFAVNTLIDAHRQGVDIDARIATLANYLGHLDPTHTYWYLTASPQLMQTVRDPITAYRDTLRLLLGYVHERTGIQPSDLDINVLDAELIAAFLTMLEQRRGNSIRTRNARLAAIH